jgi:hypothetical protein
MRWNKKAIPKQAYESTEDDAIVQINELYDSEKRFRRVGDKHAEMILSDHRITLAREYMSSTGNVVIFDEKCDRWMKFS